MDFQFQNKCCRGEMHTVGKIGKNIAITEQGQRIARITMVIIS